jgi:NitT/TauT family transport system substrate-binding protein
MRAVLVACFHLVSIFTLASTPAPAAEASQKATLRLDWTALGYHAPFYLGVARHYYQDAGLDLTILEGKGSPAVASLVGNGSDDFGFADASTVAQLISQGLPEKVVMGIFQKSTLALYFPEDRGIKSPADIRGKRIIVCPTDGMARYLPAFLKASGMTISDVKVSTVDCSIKYSYLAQGNGDLVGSYGTAGGSLLRAVGIENFGKFDYADAGIVLPSHGIIAATKTLQSQPEKVRKFIEATQKAWTDAREHPDDAVAALVAANPLAQGREKQIKATLLDSLQYIATPGTAGKPFGWQSPDEWTKTTAILVEATGMKTPASPDQFFTNEFVGGP